MLTILFLMFLYGLVAFPLTERITPGLVNAVSRYAPVVSTRFDTLKHAHRRGASAAIAALTAYPGVRILAAFVSFLFVPLSWVFLLFAALLTLPQTHDRTAALLARYVPGGNLISGALPAYAVVAPPDDGPEVEFIKEMQNTDKEYPLEQTLAEDDSDAEEYDDESDA